MNYLLYIVFGLAPSIIWLLFYLRRDKHPEPNRMVLKIFFYGGLAAVMAALLEMGFSGIMENLTFLGRKPVEIINIFLGVALIEEVAKYSVVRISILKNSELDEPIDVMLYMIIAALGFAALENVLLLWLNQAPFELLGAAVFSGFRFLGATLLHTLCAGIIGYFVALSFFENKSRSRLVAIGLWIAVLLHGMYNFSIMFIEGTQRFIIPLIILLGLSVFVTLGFKKLKRLKSVCKIA